MKYSESDKDFRTNKYRSKRRHNDKQKYDRDKRIKPIVKQNSAPIVDYRRITKLDDAEEIFNDAENDNES